MLESTSRLIGRMRVPNISRRLPYLILSVWLTLFHSRFLYALIVCLDANFRLKNQLRSSYTVDPGLGTGWAYFLPLEEYFSYVLSCASDQDVSTSCYVIAAY